MHKPKTVTRFVNEERYFDKVNKKLKYKAFTSSKNKGEISISKLVIR